MTLSAAIGNIVPSLTEVVVGIFIFVAGFVAGIFRPILSDDYKRDRDFCRELTILLAELREECESLDSSLEATEFETQQNEIRSKATELQTVIESDDVPLHRRELQKCVEQLLSDLTDVVAGIRQGARMVPESEADKKERLKVRDENMEARVSAAGDIIGRIQAVEDSYSYGILVFTYRLVILKLQ